MMTSRIMRLISVRPAIILFRTSQITASQANKRFTSTGFGPAISPLVVNNDQQRHQLLSCPKSGLIMQRRMKRKDRNEKGRQADSSDDEDEEEDEDVSPVDEETELDAFINVERQLKSVKAHDVVGAFLVSNRERLASSMYDGMFRHNGRPLVKNDDVFAGDMLDLIQGWSQMDPKKLQVKRAEVAFVADVATSKGRFKIKCRVYNDVLVDNYTEDPYTGLIQAPKKEVPEWVKKQE